MLWDFCKSLNRIRKCIFFYLLFLSDPRKLVATWFWGFGVLGFWGGQAECSQSAI